MTGWDRTRHGDLKHVNRRQRWRRRMRRLGIWWRALAAIRLPAFGDME